MLSLVGIVLFVLAVYVVFKLIHFFQVRKALNLLPGPSGYYVIGNTLDVYGHPEVIYKQLRKLSLKYNIYRLWCSYIPVVCLTDPQDIEVAIAGSENLKKGRAYEPLLPWLQTGLLTSSVNSKGRKWHTRRKLLTTSFHFNILEQFVDIFVKQAQLSVQELEQFCEKEEFNVVPYIGQFTLKTLCETAMGVQFDIDKQMEQSYKAAIQKMGEMVVHRATRPWLYPNAVFPFFPTFWKQRSVVNFLHKFSTRIIENRKAEFKPQELANGKRKKMAMLDVLLSQSSLITMKGIREEVDTFVFEGHDTSTAALGYIILRLANHKEIQDEVYREITDICGQSDIPDYKRLQNLTYTERCIKECLRLYPSVPLIARKTTHSFLTPSGYLIPAGVELVVQIYDLHHNPNIYPDPEKFDPDRFLPENVANRHPFAYLPFSGGPRNCIGQKFAMAQIKTFIVGVLRKFVIEPVDTPETVTLLQDMVLRPKNGIRIKLKPRENI